MVTTEVGSSTVRKGVAGALLRYRVMAYIVGVLLVVLVCVGVPMKYLGHSDVVVTATGIPHGWLYMLLLITAFDLGRRVRWPWRRLILIALAGTVPFLSFVAERSATGNVRAWLAAHPEESPAAAQPTEPSVPDPQPDLARPAADGVRPSTEH